jgi:hypothetical protein
VISTIANSIPIDFDKLWDIHVFVLFTIGLGLSGTKTKKASSGAQKPPGGFLLEPSGNPIWQPAPNG